MQTAGLGVSHDETPGCAGDAVPPKMYILVRRDLAPGDQAAQAVHAALAFSVEHPDVTRPWHRSSNYLVVLSVPDEQTLLDVARRLPSGRRYWMQREPDLGDCATSLAIEPDNEGNRRLLSAFPLALKEYKVPQMA